jgi:hypothetical protein
MKTLQELFNELTLSSDKETVHSYISNFYEREFAKFRKKNPTVVEVGVLYGGSIELAYNYFGKKATIIGYDIHMIPDVKQWAADKSNVRLIASDAYNMGVASMSDDIDIFIDDGPHLLHTQKRAIDLYLPKVKSGGLFVIEDIQSDDDLTALMDYIPEEYKPFAKVNNFRDTKDRYDDVIISIHKP